VVSRYRFQLDNHLGSASLEVDESGLVIGYEEYHPYGTTAYASGRGGVEVSGKRYRYTGKERDEETGLYYHGARHLAPWLARWGSCDPSGLVDGPNLYAYARNNPSTLSDPSGREATPSVVFFPNPNSVLVDYKPATKQEPIEVTVHGPPRVKKTPGPAAAKVPAPGPPSVAAVTAPSEAAATPTEAVGAFAKGAAEGLAGGLAAEFLIGVAAGAAGVSAGALAATLGFFLVPVAIYEIASHWDEITSGVDRLVHGRGTVKDFEATGDVVGSILSMRAAGPATELGAELGQAIRVEVKDTIAMLAPKLVPAGPALEGAEALESRGGGRVPKKAADGDYAHGGGKNAAHANLAARAAAREKWEAAKAELEEAMRRGATRKERSEIERLIKHWKGKMDFTGENHSQGGK
jgi:RHS repeat-associated protein